MNPDDIMGCSPCEGKGEEMVRDYYGHDDSVLRKTGEKCKHCNGTGKITRLEKSRSCAQCKQPSMVLFSIVMWIKEGTKYYDSQDDVKICLSCFKKEIKQ